MNADFVKTVVNLMEAANYFGLTNLHKMAETSLDAVMEKQPKLAFVALVACENLLDITDGVESRARQIIRSNIIFIIRQDDVLATLTPSILESILKDDNQETNDYNLFLFLQKWADWASDERLGTAAKLTKHISLECINPSKLSTTVRSSGLVTIEELCEVYQKQALYSEQHEGFLFKRLAVLKRRRSAVIFGGRGG